MRFVAWATHSKLVVVGAAGIGRDDLWQLLCFPDLFIAISKPEHIWAKLKTPWIKSVYIPYGVDQKLFQNASEAPLFVKKPRVVCIGAFVPYKRIDYLIRAMQHVDRAVLVLVGQGPEEQNLRFLGESLLGDRFCMLTGKTHDDLPGILKSASVFSLPSKPVEAFGIVYIEALAAGLRIVAPDDPIRRSMLKKSAWYVNPENEHEYANALKKALLKKSSHEKNILKEFEWDTIVQQYQNAFHSL